MEPAKIIAEIGCNHRGEMEIARKMINSAAHCGADYVKFQKRTPRELLSAEEYNSPHPVAYNAYGSTYGEHRENLEFSIDQHRELKNHCEVMGIGYSCSVWDLTSAREIISLNPLHVKIPSAMNRCKELLDVLTEEYSGGLHVSLGMTTREEEIELVKYLDQKREQQEGFREIVLYHCTSAYPAPFESLCLLNIERLQHSYPRYNIGYSGHNLGIAVDIAAFSLGARWIERHFTLDRTWKGTDHAASLEPEFLQKLVRDVNFAGKALCYRPSDLLAVEKEQRAKLKKFSLEKMPAFGKEIVI